MSRPNYKVRNRNAIRKAVKEYSSYEKSVAEIVMRNMGRAGLKGLLYAHEESMHYFGHTHNIHLNESDNMLAYAVANDGNVIESGHHTAGDEFVGQAESTAREIAQAIHGWAAVIVSDCKGSPDISDRLHWAEIQHEEDMLRISAEFIAEDWGDGRSSTFLIPKEKTQ